MAKPGTWVTIDVKVAKVKENEADYVPAASEVAAEIRQRLEGVDLDTGWEIVSVSASTLS